MTDMLLAWIFSFGLIYFAALGARSAIDARRFRKQVEQERRRQRNQQVTKDGGRLYNIRDKVPPNRRMK